MKKIILLQTRLRISFALLLLLTIFHNCGSPSLHKTGKQDHQTIVVDGHPWGQSTRYIGATEGSSRFNIADLQDLGINSYRIYGSMQRWEERDDDERYGSPSIEEIKANPNVINWAWWDKAMNDPPEGSDYWWVPGNVRWAGNARTLFEHLKTSGIQAVLVLRNKETNQKPAWSPNPPLLQFDWNEWWAHVFALAYWLNVRNDFRVDDFEAHNEPDVPEQGWHGSKEQYMQFASYTRDALDFVYKRYLPQRTYRLYGPVTSQVSDWVDDALTHSPRLFDGLDIHTYDADISSDVASAHQKIHQARRDTTPLWLSEWGSYSSDEKYDTPTMGITIIDNLIRGSEPGDHYVYGCHLFALYDFDTIPYGLIRFNGQPRLSYYAFRMAIRALQGGKTTYQTTKLNDDILSIVTKDIDGSLYLLASNNNAQRSQPLTIDFSALVTEGSGVIWRFDTHHADQLTDAFKLHNGQVNTWLPATGSLLIKIPG